MTQNHSKNRTTNQGGLKVKTNIKAGQTGRPPAVTDKRRKVDF